MTATNPAQSGARQQPRLVAENRQARHNYFIEDTVQAGIMLQGWEVKAILAGQANFNGGSAFVKFEGGEAWLDALTVTPLASSDKGLLVDRQPLRRRKLLLKKQELKKLERRVLERGYTVVPLALTYTGKLKVDLGLARGKKLADKRETVKARDLDRETQRQLRSM